MRQIAAGSRTVPAALPHNPVTMQHAPYPALHQAIADTGRSCTGQWH
jgi:hypothetical protein